MAKGLIYVGTTFRSVRWHHYRNDTRVYYLRVFRGTLREKVEKAEEYVINLLRTDCSFVM